MRRQQHVVSSAWPCIAASCSSSSGRCAVHTVTSSISHNSNNNLRRPQHGGPPSTSALSSSPSRPFLRKAPSRQTLISSDFVTREARGNNITGTDSLSCSNAAAAASVPSAHDVHAVIYRAAEDGKTTSDRAELIKQLFVGALRLGCVPLTGTYGLVLRVTLEDCGVGAVVELLDALATSPLSTRALFIVVADMLLLGASEGDNRAASAEALTALALAAAERQVQLPCRHRLPVLQELSARGSSRDILSLSSGMSLAAARDISPEEAHCVAMAAAVDIESNWETAAALMVAHAVSAAWTLTMWQQYVSAIDVSVGSVVRMGVNAGKAVEQLQTRLADGALPRDDSLRSAIDALRTAAVTMKGSSVTPKQNAYGKETDCSQLMHALNRLDLGADDSVSQLLSQQGSADVCSALVQVVSRSYIHENVSLASRTKWCSVLAKILSMYPAELLLSNNGDGDAFNVNPLSRIFPAPWLPVSSADYQSDAVVVPIWRFVVDKLLREAACKGTSDMTRETAAARVLVYARAIMAYIPTVLLTAVDRESVELPRADDILQLFLQGCGRVPLDTMEAQALWPSVVHMFMFLSNAKHADVVSFIESTVPLMVHNGGAQLLHGDTLMQLTLSQRGLPPVVAVSVFHALRRHGVDTPTSQQALEAFLHASARTCFPATGTCTFEQQKAAADVLDAAVQYARQQIAWEGDTGAIKRVAVPLLTRGGRWADAEALLSDCCSGDDTAEAKECRLNVCTAAIADAAKARDGSLVWHRWQERTHCLLPVGIFITSVEALFHAGMPAEAAQLVSTHCPQCSSRSDYEKDLRGSTFSIPLIAMRVYHRASEHGEHPNALTATYAKYIPSDCQTSGRREAMLAWRTAAAIGAAEAPHVAAAADSLCWLHGVLMKLVQDERSMHYYGHDDDCSPANSAEARVGASLLAVPWLLQLLPVLLEKVARQGTQQLINGNITNAEWQQRCKQLESVAACLTPTVASASLEVQCVWASMLQSWTSIESQSIDEKDLAVAASRVSLQLVKQLMLMGSGSDGVPLSLLQAAMSKAFLVLDDWRTLAHALSLCSQQQRQQPLWCTLMHKVSDSLAALGDVEGALLTAEDSHENKYYSVKVATKAPRGGNRAEGKDAPSMGGITAETALRYVLHSLEHRRMRCQLPPHTVGGDQDGKKKAETPMNRLELYLAAGAWREALKMLREALEVRTGRGTTHSPRRETIRVDADTTCAILTSVAVHGGGWEAIRDVWADILHAMPYYDWVPHVEKVQPCLEEWLRAMLVQHAGREEMLLALLLSTERMGVHPSMGAFELVASALADASVQPFFSMVERQRCLELLRRLRHTVSEQRMSHLVLSLTDSLGEEGETPTKTATTLAASYIVGNSDSHGRNDVIGGKVIALQQIEELAVIAPLVHVASAGQLETLSQQYIGGVLKPYELREALSVHRAAIVDLVSRSDPLAVDEAVVEHLRSNVRMHVRVSQALPNDVGEQVDSSDSKIVERIRTEVFEGFVTRGTAAALWKATRPAVEQVCQQRWPVLAEEELRLAVMEKRGRLPSKLHTAPQLTRHHIAHYWSIFHSLLLPELSLDGASMCCLAAYVPHLTAIRRQEGVTEERTQSAEEERQRIKKERISELAAIVQRTHFASGNKSTDFASTAGAVQCAPRPVWVIESMFNIAYKSLKRLHAQLLADAKSRRYYTHCYSTLPAADRTVAEVMQHPAAGGRLRLVGQLLKVQQLVHGSGSIPMAQVKHLCNAAHVDGGENWRQAAEHQYKKMLGLEGGRLGTVMTAAAASHVVVSEKATDNFHALSQITYVSLRALVRIAASYAAAGESVPPNVSLALVEHFKRGASPAARVARITRQQQSLHDLLFAWRVLSSSQAMKLFDQHHRLALVKVVCPDVRRADTMPVTHTANVK